MNSISAVRARPPVHRGDYRQAVDNANGLARATPQLKNRTAIAAVDCPIDASSPSLNRPVRRVLVTVNKTTDVLELERSHNRISEQAYATGRLLQLVFERSHGLKGKSVSSFEPGDRVDPAFAHEMHIARAIESAQAVVFWMRELEKAVGTTGAAFLRRFLEGGASYAEVAAKRLTHDRLMAIRGGKPATASERQIAAVGEQFRVMLEEVTDAFAAEGAKRRTIR